MTPLEAKWDFFFSVLPIPYLYRPGKFWGIHDDIQYIPTFKLFFNANDSKGYWVDVKSDWPLEPSDCEKAIRLYKALSEPVFIFIGSPGTHRIVVFHGREERTIDPDKDEESGYHWVTSTNFLWKDEKYEEFFFTVDTQKGVMCTPAIVGICSQCHRVSIKPDFLPCQCGCYLDAFSPSLKAVYDKVRKFNFQDYVSPRFDSPIEQLFWEQWQLLPQNKEERFPLVPQFSIDRFRVDFAYPPQKIAFELDGHATHSSPDAIAYDRRRQRYIESQGWHVIRYGGKEVFTDARACAEDVWNILMKKEHDGKLPRCKNSSCGKLLLQVSRCGHRKREYCSDTCKQIAYRERRSKAIQEIRADIAVIKEALHS